MEDASFKECPFCKEKIRKEAVKCRFCGEWLEEISHPKSESVTQNEIPPPTHHVESSQKASEDLTAQMAEKTNDQLLEMFRQPDDWLPETLNLARLELQRRGLEPPKIVPSENQKQSVPDGQKEKPSKFLFWLSIALLSITGVVWIIGLSMVHWGQMNVQEQADVIVNLLKFFFFLGIITWFTKGKSEKLLIFSVVFAVMTAIAAYYFFDARHKAQEKTAAADRQYVSDLNNLQTFLKQGAVGDIPTFKLTGDTDDDAISQVMNDFYRNYIQAYREANSAMLKLNEVDVFDDSLLTNKLNLELEIGNRMAGQQIIETLATNASSMLEAAGKEYTSQNVSDESKKSVLKSFDNLTPQFNTMFASWIKKQNADQVFLKFLNDNFGDFELKDGKILFGNQTNVQRYAELAKNVQDATAEVQGLQTQAAARVDAIKAKVQ